MSAFRQFVVFGTDNVGLERFLRLFQSFAQILLSYPLLLAIFHTSLTPFNSTTYSYPYSPTSSNKSNIPAQSFPLEILTGNLTTLRTTLNLTRRYLRLFRFLDSFASAQTLYLSVFSSAGGAGLGTWLDILRATFFGMYGLLESATLLDLSGISIFGPKVTKALNVEAQRFWFAALLCGAVAGAVRVLEMWAYKPVPESGDGFAGLELDAKQKQQGVGGEKEGKKVKEAIKENEKVKKKAIKAREARTTAKNRAVWRKLVADVLDLCLPGSTLGVFDLDSGWVGLAMMASTFVTSWDVWVKCGERIGQ